MKTHYTFVCTLLWYLSDEYNFGFYQANIAPVYMFKHKFIFYIKAVYREKVR
jgi:hypothetical protein